MNNNVNTTSKESTFCKLSISESLWKNLQLQSSEELINEFAKTIFSTASYKNLSNYQVSNSCLIQYFFGISVPLAERITSILKEVKEDYFIEEFQFLDLVNLFYKGSIRSKIIFFFKLFDYQDNKVIKKINVITLFHHIHTSAFELIDDLFNDKEEITFKEFLFKQRENMDLVLFFYFYLHQQRRINDKIIKVYSLIIKETQSESSLPPNINNSSTNKTFIKQFDNKSVISMDSQRDHVNFSPMFQSREDFNIKNAKTLQKLRRTSFIGNLQAQEKETIKRQATNKSKTNSNLHGLPFQQFQNTEILNAEFIPKNTNKFYDIIQQAFGIDVRTGSFPDMPKLNPKRKEISSRSILTDNFDDLTELDAFENDIQSSLSKKTVDSQNNFRFFEKINCACLNRKSNDNNPRMSMNPLKCECGLTAIRSSKIKNTLEIFKPKHTKSFHWFEDSPNNKQNSLSLTNSTFIKSKNLSFDEYHHSSIMPNEDFILQNAANNDISGNILGNNNGVNIDELNLTMKYSVYDYQFHFGMLFLIGNFIFFVCGKKKEQGQNIIYSLLVDRSFITQEDKELIQIIMPFGNGQIYKFRFNSQIKKNEFLLNIGYSNKFFDTYKLQREIGRGKFGVVWEGVKGRKMYAIKVFNKRGRFKLCRREVYINSFLMKHKHKQIVDIEEIYETGDTVYIVMEYIKDGDINENNIHAILEQYKYPLKASEKLLTQVINVIDYLHKYGIVHRDLKLDNILVTDISTLEIKLMDFGLATVINSDETIYEKCGTIIYAAPEIFNKTKYNRNIDLWNIGIIAYFLHFKQFPITKFKLKDINMALNKLIGVVDGISLNDLKENFLLQVIKSCLIKSQMLRKKCSVLLENYAQYINNKKNN